MTRKKVKSHSWDATIEAIGTSLHKLMDKQDNIMPEKSGGDDQAEKTPTEMVQTPEPVQKMVAPDGGWGWIVVFGVAIANMTTQSLMSTFGLLFGDALKSMGHETTGAALVLNVMSAITNLSGLITGPVIKRFSYRKVALLGGVLFSGGIFLASMATTMTQLIFSYSLLSGLGLGLTTPASFVALSTYFSKRRGYAVGLALVGTGLGQMLMPLGVRIFLDNYGFQGAMLIIGGISLHAIIGATLYQPVKRHLVPAELPPPPEDKTHEKETLNPEVKVLLDPKPETTGEPTPESLSPRGSEYGVRIRRSEGEVAGLLRVPPSTPDFKALRRLSSAELGSNLELDVLAAPEFQGIGEDLMEEESVPQIIPDVNQDGPAVLTKSEDETKREDKSKRRRRKLRTLLCNCCSSIVDAMDLHLFLDPVFVNIVVGLAIFHVSNINFSMVFPFFIIDLGFTKSDAALCMSVTAGSDIIARLTVPWVTDRVKVMGSRNTLLVAMVALAFVRSLLAQQTGLQELLGISVLCGFVRGAAVLNLNLSIAEYCCNEKLPAALGINMVLKFFAILSLGPFLGWLRDATGSFPICMHAQSLLLLLTATAWTIEMVVRWRRRRQQKILLAQQISTP